ncbi:MAG: hypothetical protein IPK67_05920 [Planctomycetes bacterium]|nr:hypothetical protein [Planctomycetota bacterium]
MKLAAAASLALLLAACGSSGGLDAYGNRETAPSALPVPVRDDARAARAALNGGDAAGARSILERACERAPGDLGLAVMLQEAELAAGEEPQALRARYGELARQRNDARSWVLAARLEPDGAPAREALDRALSLDPGCAWALYGRAFHEAREGEWTEAQKLLAQALSLDAALLPARRLEAALFARDGKYEQAQEAFEAWLEAAQDDPRVDPALRVATVLDLALVDLESGSPRAARDRLASLTDGPADAASLGRRLCVLAAVEQALGHSELALEAAQAAERASPDSPLAKVQQALLHEQWLGDPVAAKEAWQRVLGEARTSGDLTDLIQSMRARVVLERLESASGAPKPR